MFRFTQQPVTWILYVSPYWKPFWIFVRAVGGTREWSPALNLQIDPELTWPRMIPFLARRWAWNDPQGIPRTGILNKLSRNRNTNIFSIKRVNRKIKEVWRFSRAKHRQGNVQKSVLHVQSCFMLIRKKVCCTCKGFFCQLDLLLLFFTVLVVFTLSLVLLNFILSLRKLYLFSKI